MGLIVMFRTQADQIASDIIPTRSSGFDMVYVHGTHTAIL
jgi:hypothetical protein